MVMITKKNTDILDVPSRHWVGDGFPVRSLLSYNRHGRQVSPFLLLDYTGTAEFPPANRPRGVGQHPHRGFETVTIVYKGEVAHRDSTGKGGVIGPGDVQWMTAASGILHQEFHSDAFTRSGGTLAMAQLWVNLPAKDKMSAPAYQAILDADIPAVALAGNAGVVRVIAGMYDRHTGPAHTFSPLHVWDIHLKPGAAVELPGMDGWTAAVVVLHGQVQLNGSSIIMENQVALLDVHGDGFRLETGDDALVLYLSGESLDEPIAGYGPFVMNTDSEIAKAIDDYNSGKFGQIVR
jgi:redox-sensitive bicupin YhaK (pirin superfamily)